MYTIPRPFFHSIFQRALDIRVNVTTISAGHCGSADRRPVFPSVCLNDTDRTPTGLPCRRIYATSPSEAFQRSDAIAAVQGAGDRAFPDSPCTVHRRGPVRLPPPPPPSAPPRTVAHRMAAGEAGEEQTNGSGTFLDHRERWALHHLIVIVYSENTISFCSCRTNCMNKILIT